MDRIVEIGQDKDGNIGIDYPPYPVGSRAAFMRLERIGQLVEGRSPDGIPQTRWERAEGFRKLGTVQVLGGERGCRLVVRDNDGRLLFETPEDISTAAGWGPPAGMVPLNTLFSASGPMRKD